MRAGVLAAVVLMAGAAQASDWYQPGREGNCISAVMSPAQLYEGTTKMGMRPQLSDHGDRVDVMTDRHWIFFRTEAACESFVSAERARTAPERQRMEQFLSNYR